MPALEEYSSTILLSAYSSHRHDVVNYEAQLLVTKQAIENIIAHLDDLDKRLGEGNEHQDTHAAHDLGLHVLDEVKRQQMELLTRLRATENRISHCFTVSSAHMMRISAVINRRRSKGSAIPTDGEIFSVLNLNEVEVEKDVD